mmetsp:Transcript_118451/g.334923  ORF Transcript_118451/g.334923 Transcript_118451/m.334923 type:complete len:719 (+) Transcript_118451:50-2206(+)
MAAHAQKVEHDLPSWAALYASRFLTRFPEVFFALGQSSLQEQFHLPPSGKSRVYMEETNGGQRHVRVFLSRKTPSLLPEELVAPTALDSNGFFHGGESEHVESVCWTSITTSALDEPETHSGWPLHEMETRAANVQEVGGFDMMLAGCEYSVSGPTSHDSPRRTFGFDSSPPKYDKRAKCCPDNYEAHATEALRLQALKLESIVEDEFKGWQPAMSLDSDCQTGSTADSTSTHFSESTSFSPQCDDFSMGATTMVCSIATPEKPCETTPTRERKPFASAQSSEKQRRLSDASGGLMSRRGLVLQLPCSSPASSLSESSQHFETPHADAEIPASAKKAWKKWRNRCGFLSGGSLPSSPENQQSCIQLSTPCHGSCSFLMGTRKLPVAFPNHRGVIFFDWDDTLCPTTWLRHLLKDALADIQNWSECTGAESDCVKLVPEWFLQPLPDDPAVHELINELQCAVINMLNVAQAYGAVCIVTNACPGWVEKTIKKWMPKLREYIFGHGARGAIKLVYGQEAFKRRHKGDISWVDELGEYMWWKADAMTECLNDVEDLYRFGADRADVVTGSSTDNAGVEAAAPGSTWCSDSSTKHVLDIISIGDNEAEMQAAEFVGCRRSMGRRYSVGDVRAASSRSPNVKLVKFREGTHVRHLCSQLECLTHLFPQLVSLRKHIRCDLGAMGQLSLASPSSSSDIASAVEACGLRHDCDHALERRIRTQTV